MRKRRETGLSSEEADELGRMLAERSGKPYSNADLEAESGYRSGRMDVDDAVPADPRPDEEADTAGPAPDDKAATGPGEPGAESRTPEHGRRPV